MNILTQLGSLSLKGAGLAAEHLTGVGAAAGAIDGLVGLLQRQFSDHSARLTRALERSSRHAWRAAELSLAGRSWWDRCKVALASGDDRAIRRQVQAYLDAHPLDGIDGHGPDFRAQCLAQLRGARRAGLLDRGRVDPADLARRVGDLSRFGDGPGRVDAEYRVLDDAAEALRRHGYEALATFLTLRPAAGPPLLVAAMRYFFQREVENDRELFQGLTHARLEGLSEGQRAGFADLGEALDAGLDRLEGLLADVQAVVARTHGDVLDVKAELARQGRQMDELGQAVLRALAGQQLERRELRGADSFSLRNEDERRLVRDLVRRYRGLPPGQRRGMPALLNAVGKLEVMAGDFAAAEKDFRDVATMVGDGPARAEAAHNAYSAALEARDWGAALASLREAMALDPARFAPFPAEKFEAERILGAGGFGVAFLCRNRHSGFQVVIKTLRRDGLDRDLGDVFREAQALEALEHPAIIRVRDCDFADAGHTRPYFVMDFFEGPTLAEYVERYGVLEPGQAVALARLLADGLGGAHARGILHRDVKPGNVLVRQTPAGWQARLIDFGLALRAATVGSTQKASLDRTLAGASIAGTIEYAAPEQMGRVKGVAVGPYSDVYGFGKTCCFALFGTPQPTFQHWRSLPAPLAELLGRCLNEQPRERPQSFAEVLRELDGPVAPGRAPAPLMNALPVEEVERLPDRRPPARPPRERLPDPAPRPRRDRAPDRPPDRDPREGLGVTAVVFGLLALLVVVGLGALVVMSLRVRPTATLIAPPATPIDLAGGGGPIPGPVGPAPPQNASTWPPDLSAVEPIPPAEFAGALDELTKKPGLPRLRALAGRLARTAPTPAQRNKHDAVREATELARAGGGPGKNRLEELKKADDVSQVALALQPLLEQGNRDDRWYAATALQKWGTADVVPALIKALETRGYGGDSTRIAAMTALGAIRDPRGLAPVVKRLTGTWEGSMRSADVVDAVAAFGPMVEKEMWPFLEKRNLHTSGANACGVLERVGTEKSLPLLEEVKGNIFVRKQAAAAIAAIKRRTGKP